MTMKRQWTHDELAKHWTLLPDELKLLANKTGATRLGFGLLLKAFAYQGRFPRHMRELPGSTGISLTRSRRCSRALRQRVSTIAARPDRFDESGIVGRQLPQEGDALRRGSGPLQGRPVLLVEQPLIQAQASDYVRQSQERLIGAPILELLKARYTPTGTEQRLLHLLDAASAGGHLLRRVGDLGHPPHARFHGVPDLLKRPA
jgi:hypothetical protein